MTVATMITAFQAINGQVAGVTAAPDSDALPGVLTDDLLPCVITLPGQATWHPGIGLGKAQKCRRAYHVRLYAYPATQDTPIATTAVLALLEAIGTTYRAIESVGGARIVSREDQGYLRTYAYGGAQFAGSEFRITVEEPA